MPKIDIKPLSVNEAWQGRRFKTKAYDKYISDMLMLLPPLRVSSEGDKPLNGKIELEITFGLSSCAADIDNPLKCFIDCLQKKYDFDDKMIYRLIVNKEIVKKGKEFIEFNIKNLNSG
jgi:Holliday junction resolvase RusA-like endonuclease